MLTFSLLLAVIAAEPDPTPVVHTATVVRPPAENSTWFEVIEQGEVDSTYPSIVTGEPLGADEPAYSTRLDEAVVWHLDPRVVLGRRALVPGVRIRWTSVSCYTMPRVEVVCLGPLAMAVSVEEWVVEAAEGRLAAGLTPGEMATLDALGSPAWIVRDSVSRALAERGPRALRLLTWGRLAHRDTEVRTRCEALMERLGWRE